MSRLPRRLAILMALAAHCVSAATVTINPSADTCLFELNPDNNWGAEPEVVAGSLAIEPSDRKRSRALLKFDIAAAVPAGSTITSARLKLRCVRIPMGEPGPGNSSFNLFRVSVPWVEGTKVSDAIPVFGLPADEGETTWQSFSDGGVFEVDFAEDSSASQPVTGLGSYFFDFNTLGICDIQSMLDSPADNHGWILITAAESTEKTARRWASREHAEFPPELAIVFTPPPSPEVPEITGSQLDPNTGSLSVDFLAKAGTTYRLETRSDLNSGMWSAVESLVATSDTPRTLTTTPPPGTTRLFFRVTAELSP